MKYLLILTTATILFIPKVKSQNAESVIPFESTVTYKMLRMDTEVFPDNSKEISLCKALVEKAVDRIKKSYSLAEIQNANANVAIRILGMIDSTFTEFDFMFYTNDKDVHYDFLTLAFRDTFDGKMIDRNNEYRISYWKNKKDQKHRLIDCDQYCRIYAGIAEMANLPLTVVHIPTHYYVRWHFSPSKYLSWNPNDGKAYPIESEIESFYRWENLLKAHPKQLLPPDLDFQATFYNYLAVRADLYFLNTSFKDISKAKRDYETLLKMGRNNEIVFINYVWLHIMYPQFDKSLDLKKLHSYIDSAFTFENNLNFYDARACLYAIKGDFLKAIKVEKEGLKVTYDPYNKRDKAQRHLECFEQKKVCRGIN